MTDAYGEGTGNVEPRVQGQHAVYGLEFLIASNDVLVATLSRTQLLKTKLTGPSVTSDSENTKPN